MILLARPTHLLFLCLVSAKVFQYDHLGIKERGTMRYVKKRIKGNRIINLLEVMSDETSFSIVSANATIKLMTKAGNPA